MGTIDVAVGTRQKVASLLMAHRARCLREEPGTLQFDVLLPRDDQSKILVYEVYRDDEAFLAHCNGPSLARWREQKAEMDVKVSTTRCTPAD
jgi:quinol monooxygenase YgiN